MGDASTTPLGSSGEAAAVAEDQIQVTCHEEDGETAGRGGGGSANNLSANSAEEDNKDGGRNGGDDAGDRTNCGGNRWPRQETLALLKIRSDMDSTFRDSSLKGPLWEEVSRKLGELGYKRSAKKCKEKFENVYKYHKRTKEGRTGKSDGNKTYRFFDQLSAFDQNHHPPVPLPPPPQPQKPHQVISSPPTPWTTNTPISTSPTPPPTTTISHIIVQNPTNSILHSILPLPTTTTTTTTTTTKNINCFPAENLLSSPTSSSTASDEDFQARGRKRRKRKWKDFFRRLTRQVMRKQEELQRKFLEAVEKSENARIAREEAWRLQEMARGNREHEILVQERSTAAAKDAAVIAFLQKVSTPSPQNNSTELFSIRENNNNNSNNNNNPMPPPPPPPPPPTPVVIPKSADYGGGEAAVATVPSLSSTSRWPKAEVEALINLRRRLDLKYLENVPKGPLWEDISAGMRRLGYDRNSKRCKEKWENINKYFKKVKDSSKKRSEDSKTCPYFHQLDALYKEKITNSINSNNNNNNNNNSNNSDFVSNNNSDNIVINNNSQMEPLMVQPERQWPVDQTNVDNSAMEDSEEEEEDRESSSTEPEEDHHDDHDRGGGSYAIVTSKQSSMDMVE